MKKRTALMRALAILGVLLVVALASPAMSAPEKSLAIKNMKVSLWPEYDDPRILVTYQGEFKDGAAFPQPVKFPAPLGSEMNQVCALKPPNDEHLCQLFDVLTASDELTISYTLPIPTYYTEYYWDGVKGESDKSLTFKYVSPYTVDKLELEVQQPLKATNFKLAQPYASVTSDGQGMKYYHYTFNNVTQGQVISIDASYTKPDNKPSVAKKTGSGTASTSGGGASGSNAYAFVIIGAAMLAVVAIGFMWLKRRPAPARVAAVRAPPVMQSRKATREARRIEAQRVHQQTISRPSRPGPARAAPAATPRPSGGAVFCSNCGNRLAEGGQFCHVCGARAKGTA